MVGLIHQGLGMVTIMLYKIEMNQIILLLLITTILEKKC